MLKKIGWLCVFAVDAALLLGAVIVIPALLASMTMLGLSVGLWLNIDHTVTALCTAAGIGVGVVLVKAVFAQAYRCFC